MIINHEADPKISEASLREDGEKLPARERAYPDPIIGVVSPICGELSNGHLQDSLASIAACTKHRSLLNIFVVNNTELSARLHCLLEQLGLSQRHEISRYFGIESNISFFLEEYKKYFPVRDEGENAFLIDLQYASNPRGDSISDLIERFRENQLTIELMEIISQTNFQLNHSWRSSLERDELKRTALENVTSIWNSYYPGRSLPFGFRAALSRTINLEVVDQSSLGKGSDFVDIGLARDAGGKLLFDLAPNCLAVYFRDADTLLTDQFIIFLTQKVSERPDEVILISQRLRPAEPAFPSTEKHPTDLDSLVRKVMKGTISRAYSFYASTREHHAGGSQLCIPKNVFMTTGYPQGAGSEDYAMSSMILGNLANLQHRSLDSRSSIILKNRISPFSFDGNMWHYFSDDSDLFSYETQAMMLAVLQEWVNTTKGILARLNQSQDFKRYLQKKRPLGMTEASALFDHLIKNEVAEANRERSRWRGFTWKLFKNIAGAFTKDGQLIGQIATKNEAALTNRQKSFLDSSPLAKEYLYGFVAGQAGKTVEEAWREFETHHDWLRPSEEPDLDILLAQSELPAMTNVFDHLWVVGFREKLLILLDEVKNTTNQ